MTKTQALLSNRSEVLCCPACALAAHRRMGRPVRVMMLTDYASERPVAPRNAYIVEGSDASTCSRSRVLVDRDRQISPLEFDRCSPSILAFANRTSAANFAAEHGGTVMRFEDLSPAYAR